MSVRSVAMLCVLSVACSACATKQDAWADIDYSKVYKAAGEQRDVDTGYRPPSVTNCVDDDLYNCR